MAVWHVAMGAGWSRERGEGGRGETKAPFQSLQSYKRRVPHQVMRWCHCLVVMLAHLSQMHSLMLPQTAVPLSSEPQQCWASRVRRGLLHRHPRCTQGWHAHGSIPTFNKLNTRRGRDDAMTTMSSGESQDDSSAPDAMLGGSDHDGGILRNVIVTGANRGLGFAIADRMLKLGGYRVILACRSEQQVCMQALLILPDEYCCCCCC